MRNTTVSFKGPETNQSWNFTQSESFDILSFRIIIEALVATKWKLHSKRVKKFKTTLKMSKDENYTQIEYTTCEVYYGQGITFMELRW